MIAFINFSARWNLWDPESPLHMTLAFKLFQVFLFLLAALWQNIYLALKYCESKSASKHDFWFVLQLYYCYLWRNKLLLLTSTKVSVLPLLLSNLFLLGLVGRLDLLENWNTDLYFFNLNRVINITNIYASI